MSITSQMIKVKFLLESGSQLNSRKSMTLREVMKRKVYSNVDSDKLGGLLTQLSDDSKRCTTVHTYYSQMRKSWLKNSTGRVPLTALLPH